MSPLPSYTLIVGHSFVLLLFCVLSSASHRLMKSFYTSMKLNTQVVNCGCPLNSAPRRAVLSLFSLHIRISKENLLKFEPQEEIQPFWMDFPYIGPLGPNSRVLDAWKIYHQKIKGSSNSYRARRSSSTPPT